MINSIQKVHKLAYICGALFFSLIASVLGSGLAGAVSAPSKINADYQPYYYVAKGVSDNGQFPATWIGFYWDTPGVRTINYDAIRCNDGGYINNGKGSPNITFYRLNSNGGVNEGSVIAGSYNVSKCSSGTTSYSINVDGSSYDPNIGKYGVVVRVGVADSSIRTRAWFNISTADVDGADYGAMGGKPLGYSRDFKSFSDSGWYYDMETGFGSCDATSATNQTIQFFDIDNSSYQSVHPLRVAIINNGTGQWIPNTSSSFVGLDNVNRHPGDGGWWFNVTGNSAEYASITLNTAPKAGYRLRIVWVREGNDVSIQVPSNEIYSKKACIPKWYLSAKTSVDKATSVPGETVTWTHSVRNDGPDNTDTTGQTIVSRYQNVNSGATNDWDDGTRDNNYGLFRARADRNYCIDVQDGSVSFGARVRSLSCNGTGAQLFRPFPVDNSIRNAKSNLCLDVPSGSGAGTMIKLHGCNGSRAQRFVYDSNSGEIRYTDGSGNILCLDRVGNQYWDGDLQVWNCNGLDNQKWIIDNAARTYDPSWRGVNNPGATGSEGQDYMSAGATRTFNSSYVIKQDDVGKVLCRRTNATGSSYDYNNWLYGPSACTNIPYNYKVTPTTRADKTDMKLGDTVNFTYSLNNQGPTKSQAMQYRAYAFILKQGQTIDTSGPKTYSTFTAAQCGGRGVSATLTKYCTGVATGSGVIIGSGVNPYFNLNVAYDVNSSSIVTNAGSWSVDPGDKVCSYVAVDSWSSSSSLIDQIVASNIQCVGIDKNPQLQIRGADSWSGGIWTNQDGTKYSGNGGFQGYSQSIPERGSWSQYGLLADKGPISGFGSAGYTASLPTLNQINGCKLIFANVISGTSCPNTGGSLNSGSSIMHSIDLPRVAYMTDSELRSRALDINDNSIKALNTQYVDLSTITSGVYLVNGDESETASDVTVGGSLSDNVHVTLIFRKDAYVYFDITTQSSTFSDISKVPSLNLIANNFYFISNDMLEVTNIYGTYIARDSFHSAYSAEPGGESKYMSATGDYSSQLKINGAIISKNSPRFQRTLGGGKSSTNITTNDEIHTDATTAAEIINYQPNLFLTPYLINKTSTDATWVTTRETVLPARY